MGNVQFTNFGANIFVADLVGIAMVREMGVVMTGIIMSGRTGAAFAPHIGSMKANEEIDALRTFGLNHFDFLVLPRLLTLMLPLLTIYSNITGIARVVSTNLRRLTGSRAILPIDDFIALDYSHLVELRITQFDPDATGNLILRCSWKAQPVKGGDVKSQSFSTAIPISVTTPSMTSRITAMNEALEQLARVIAKSL